MAPPVQCRWKLPDLISTARNGAYHRADRAVALRQQVWLGLLALAGGSSAGVGVSVQDGGACSRFPRMAWPPGFARRLHCSCWGSSSFLSRRAGRSSRNIRRGDDLAECAVRRASSGIPVQAEAGIGGLAEQGSASRARIGSVSPPSDDVAGAAPKAAQRHDRMAAVPREDRAVLRGRAARRAGQGNRRESRYRLMKWKPPSFPSVMLMYWRMSGPGTRVTIFQRCIRPFCARSAPM